MDEPNVNRAFEYMLLNCLKKCLIHDTFAVAIHLLFKLSRARREDYSKLMEITDFVAQYEIKQPSIRWVTLKYVALQLSE